MRRATWHLSLLILVAGSVAADRPEQVAKKSGPRVEAKEKAKAKAKVKAKVSGGSPRAAVQASSKPTASPDLRASSLFRSAQNLEKDGKNPGAIGLYRDVLIRYPASPEASESAARIKALGGKMPAPSEINPAPPAEEAKFTRPPKPKYASQEATRAALNQALGGMIGSAASQPASNGPANGYRNRGSYSP
jgi:hypothetical protein